MKLTKVEMIGFKSFQKKTTFEFNSNLIGVVGPNGSGKSNIIDAIRWVLGEQSAKNLRGSSMKDVIFSGTEEISRKNFAEVAITFKDDEDEYEVKRRLYRNGDSEYFINGKRTKLKDINNFYLDFGINKESYGIITQGKVEDIISSKPIDRRSIIEEASGVLKYKNKKKETTSKLEKTTENLIRLNDIFSEISSRYEVLEEQKDKTTKYLSYTNELEEKDILINVYNISKYQKQLQDVLENKSKSSREKENLEKKQADLLAELERVKNNLVALDKTYLKYHDEELVLVQQKESLQSQLNVIEERKNNRTINSEKIEEDLKYLFERKESLEKKLEERTTSVEEYKNKIKSLNEEITKLEKSEEYNLEKIEENIENLKDRYYTLVNEETKLENSLEFTKKNLETADETYKELLKNIDEDNELHTKKLEEIEEIKKNKTEKEHEVDLLEKSINKLLEEGIVTSSNIKNIDEQLRTGYNFQNNLENRKRFLEEQISNLSFYNVGVKEILANKDTLGGVHDSIANIISFDNDYAVSLDIALGLAQQNIVVENENTAKLCIEHLKKSNKGRVTFLPLNNIKERVIPADIYKKVVSEEGFINIAENLVRVDSKYKSIISHLLGLVIIVDNMDNANRIARKINFRNRIITLDGQVINSGGSITGGAINKNNNSSIKHKAELEELSLNLSKINNKIEKLTNDKNTLEERSRDYQQRVSSEKEKKDNLSLKIKELELAQNHKNIEIENIDVAIEKNREKLKSYQQNKGDFDDITTLTKDIEQIKEQLRELDKKIIEENNKKQNAQKAEDEYLEKIAECKIDKSKLEENVKHINELVVNINQDLKDVTSQIERLEFSKKQEALSEEDEKNIHINNLKMIEDASNRLNNLKILLSDLDMEKSGLFKREKEITTSQQKNNELLRSKVAEFEKISVEQTKIEVKLDEYVDTLIETYNVTYEAVKDNLTQEHSQNIESYKEDVVKLRSNISQLGNVNLNAIEEFSEIKERYDFYNEQITDLIEAKEKLEKTIAEIDKEVKERFLETFVQVAENFNKIFKELFKGGYADMTLETPNDILNTGIVIEASPPGKKLQNLSLLSGGEKSLTAISLLFAILKVKNPPFVVLDEVEAALDEENVNRFAKFLKLYSMDNQFLVITHRRGTMEAMDTLYGVTMQEKGISYILELELKDIVETFEEMIK